VGATAVGASTVTATDPVRIGIVGYGLGGRVFHAPLIASAIETELVGVVTTNPERRSQLATDHPGVSALDDLKALVAVGAEAVAISSTTGTHTVLTDEALDLGLHVLCDKPLALDAAASAASIARAQAAGLLLTAFQNRRWDSDFLTVRRILAEGALGQVYRFESRFERWAPGPPRTQWRSELPAEQGGGIRLDLMTHLADQAMTLFGPVASVYAEMATRRASAIPEDDVSVLLTHTDGVSSQLFANTMSGDISRRFRVLGTDAAYVVGGADGQEDALRAGRTPASEGVAWGIEPPEAWGYIARGTERVVVPTERGRWDTFYPAFAAAVRGTGPLPVDVHEALAVLEVLDAIAVSARESRVVTLTTSGQASLS
jgi:predicted dehydrogenase